MGLAASLFGYRAEEPSAYASPSDWLAFGKREFFLGRIKSAQKAFSSAANANPYDPLPLAYLSWAGRRTNKLRAIADAEKAVALDSRCAEAFMSLALAHVTHSLRATDASREADFRRAVLALRRGEQLAPTDAYGAVLLIGVHLLFFDILASMREFPDQDRYDFLPTPLRNAAGWLLSGQHVAAHKAFDEVADSGRYLLGALGKTATSWAMRDIRAAGRYASVVIDSDTCESQACKSPGLLAAVTAIAVTTQR
jgi:tetratricopeptide (TPR) repeat protein